MDSLGEALMRDEIDVHSFRSAANEEVYAYTLKLSAFLLNVLSLSVYAKF